MVPKERRLAEFLRRLNAAAPAGSFDDAYNQLCETLNAVEDELAGVPYDITKWMSDGRMYPPQQDNMKVVANDPETQQLRSFAHITYISRNGAITIKSVLTGEIILSKPGADGREVELR